jgi:threonine dehydrogenase-like Zn-dependent dehydrogenase
MNEGDMLGHETVGIVEKVRLGITTTKLRDRVVITINISCGKDPGAGARYQGRAV